MQYGMDGRSGTSVFAFNQEIYKANTLVELSSNQFVCEQVKPRKESG